MERSGLFIPAAVICCLLAVSYARAIRVKDMESLPVYNHTLAKILVQYDAAVYESDLTELFSWTCSKCNGPTEGFEVIELIVDVQHCLQSYVGIAKDLNAIIIAFRGTQENSIQNWVSDLYWKQLDINYPGMPDAMVHHGFYNAYHNTTLRPGVTYAVKRARKIYSDMRIIVLGHSMGGAIAAFCALDLTVHNKVKGVEVMTFGQPRVGNSVFASYYSERVPNTIRVTHEHDIVPHLPPYYTYFPRKTYHHFPREVWLYNIGFGSLVYTAEKVCDGSGEDESCGRWSCRKLAYCKVSRQHLLSRGSHRLQPPCIRDRGMVCRHSTLLRPWSVMGNSIVDHLIYFGVNLQAESWNSCRIVTDSSLANYASNDHAGNIVLRKPTSVLKMKTRSDGGNDTI